MENAGSLRDVLVILVALALATLPYTVAAPCHSGGSTDACGNRLAAGYDSECACAAGLCCSR